MIEQNALSTHYTIYRAADEHLYESIYYTIFEPRDPIATVDRLVKSPFFPASFQVVSCGAGIPRDVSHFSEEANAALGDFFHVFCSDSSLQENLQQKLVQENQRVGHFAHHMLSLQINVNSIQFWASPHLNSIALIVKIGIESGTSPITLADILFVNRYARDFFDEFFRDLAIAPAATAKKRRRAKISASYPRSQDAVTIAGSIRHLAKPLSYCAIDAGSEIFRGERVGVADEQDLDLWLRAGARSKTGVFKDDVAHNPLFPKCDQMVTTDTVFQQWGSTKFAFTPVGAFVLSLSHNHGYEVVANTSKDFMMKWIEYRFLPILIIVEFQKEYLLRLSRDIAATGTNKKENVIDFRNRIWFYSMTNDIQDERIWLEAKHVHGLDALFESVNRQVEDHSQFQLNKLLKVLTFAQIFVGLSEILTAIHPFVRPLAPLSYWLIAAIAAPLSLTLVLVFFLQRYLKSI